jgi:hypothetical protein
MSTTNSIQEKVTNSTTKPHRAPSMMTTTATAPVTASTPYSCPLLDKQRDNQVSNKITESIPQVKKSRLGDAGDLPHEPLKQVDSNTLNQFVFKPGPRETAKHESISSQCDPLSPHSSNSSSSLATKFSLPFISRNSTSRKSCLMF